MFKSFFKKVNNLRIKDSNRTKPPAYFLDKYPLSNKEVDLVAHSRETIENIIAGKDKRLMVIIGPCSIHDPKAALEYAQKLKKISDELCDKLFIVMRVYFEKPRTTIGWKGLVNDPHLDESYDMEHGLDIARKLLLDIAKIGLPTAVEYLDLISPQYFSDLITWGAIGARTTESQTHRELASGMSCPIGFKNGTDGGVQVAIDAVISSSYPHSFWSVSKTGILTRYTTGGNPNCHIILRGGGGQTNYDEKSINNACNQLEKNNLTPKLMVDFSHANSEKQHKNQIKVGDEIIEQMKNGSDKVFGVMIESHLKEGNQKINTLDKLEYGVSITDACLGWEDSEELLRNLAAAK
jgi:3-deoxy-7-phosphoheptulonate synthase